VRRRWLIPLTLLASQGALAQGFLQRSDPGVAAANKHYDKGEYDQALRGYEDAAREHPNTPELDFDRGNALFKLERRDEARAAYLSALAAPNGHFKAQDYYNLGNALWELDRKDAAADAYQRALVLDPSLEDARHNLEILLAPPPPHDGGSADGGGSGDGGAGDGGSGDGGRSHPSDGGQGNSDGGSNADGGEQDRSKDSEGQHDAGSGRDGGAQPPEQNAQQPPKPERPQNAQAEPLDQQKSEQLLDALRQREKNLQLWRFRQKQKRTRDAEKDW
jgi:tetratricopeptide (TPR) repeat protein